VRPIAAAAQRPDMLTFDILLLYYDNPITLRNWLARLLHHTDYLQYADRSNIIVADTGTPLERIPATLEVLRAWKHLKKPIYFRANTEQIRTLIPPGAEPRPSSLTYNIAMRMSQADLLFYSILPHIYLPHYFGTALAMHEANPRLFLQPLQFRLTSQTYHLFYYDRPFDEALLSGISERYNGMPDPSVRREHVLAVGGWEEEIITWGMSDIDICTRLTGKTDMGIPAHVWYQAWTGKPRAPYPHYGLELCRAYSPTFYSLFCKEYPGSMPYGSPCRNLGAAHSMNVYLKKWGIIPRNQQRVPITYQVYDY
jgi:hypothetical protein